VTDVRVPCGDCRLCCQLSRLMVLLSVGDEDVAEELLTRRVTMSDGSFAMEVLKDADGECVYLTPDGCGIYDWRPVVCRGFDCRRWGTRFFHARRDDDPTVRAIEKRGAEISARQRRRIGRAFNRALRGASRDEQ